MLVDVGGGVGVCAVNALLDMLVVVLGVFVHVVLTIEKSVSKVMLGVEAKTVLRGLIVLGDW